MKNYEEVAKSVFEKSEKYFEEKAVRAKRIKTAVSAMSCFCIAAVITVIAVAAINSNLTEYPTGGRTDGGIPENTTTAETESLYTMPELMTDENGDPVYPDIDIPDDIWENPEAAFSTVGGVNVPFFLAFDGALYVKNDSDGGGPYGTTGLTAYLGERFGCAVYQVGGKPDHIGVQINSVICEYKKLYDCNFDIDGTKYQIVYSALKDIDYACGDMVLQTDDFTVYEAVRLQNGNPIETVDSNQQEFEALQEDEILSEQKTKVYIVDLLPVLKRELPNLFSNDGDGTLNGDDVMDYGDKWWIALSSNDIPDDIGNDYNSPDHIWQTPEEILGDDIPPIDTSTSVYLAYDGALYEYSSDSESDSHFSEKDRYYALTGRYAYSYGVGFPREAYAVKGEPDLIMIEKDYVLFEYKKILDCNFEINGKKYEIVSSAILQADYDYGDLVLQTKDFKVYEAIRLNGFPPADAETKEYLINLYPVLVREEPNQEMALNPYYPDYPPENSYGVDVWWLALPCDAADEMSHVDVPPEDPSLPINTLTGVTPIETAKILAAAKAAHSGYDKSVFVQTNIEEAVYSLKDGVVVMEGWDAWGGKTVIVQTTDGDYIMYCHLSEIFVKKGDTAAWGKVIGLTGNTGATAYTGVEYAVITSLPAPEKCAVIFPDIPEEMTESEIIEEIIKLGVSVTCVYSDDVDETVIPTEENAEILSLTDGEVIWIKKYGDTDNSVCVQYSEDTFVYYNHLSRPNVRIGDTVSEGQRIGYAGDIEFLDSIFDFGAGYRLTHTPPPLIEPR